MMYNSSVLLIAKNEHDYIIEWLEYHLKLGFEHFFIYDNNSVYPLKDQLANYIKQRYVTVEDFPMTCCPQIPCYQQALKQHGDKTKWLGIFDADEFLILKNNLNVIDFLREYEEYPAVAINWKVYTGLPHTCKPEGKVLDNFKIPVMFTHWVNGHYKSIVQLSKTVTIDAVHCGVYRDGHAVNPAKIPVDGPFNAKVLHDLLQASAFDDLYVHPLLSIDHSIACFNHYYTKSLEEWEKKVVKGRADVVELRSFDWFYKINNQSIIGLEI